MSEETPWEKARLLHLSEGHAERFMVDCDHWRCLLAYAWYWQQEKLQQAINCPHPARQRAMFKHLHNNP